MSLAVAFAPITPDIPPLFDHQVESVAFYHDQPQVLNHSDPGTGKTRAWLEWLREHRESGGGAGLVLCPKSIMQAAWRNDAARYCPELKVSVAAAENRRDGLKHGADLYVVNHDAVRSLIKDPSMLPAGLDAFNLDESTAYKNASSLRSKAARKLLKPFTYRTLMSGTPMPQGVVDLWHQALLCDHGERLGDNYFRFRNTVCRPEKIAPHLPHINWVEMDGAADAVADILSEIILRFELEKVIDMPPKVEYFVDHELSTKHAAAYEELLERGRVMAESGDLVRPTNAAALRTKLLQLCLAQGTEVLTDHGWLPIQTLHQDKHRVWDGHEWAQFDEVLNQGWQSVVECYGVNMTPDHLVLTTDGWLSARNIIYDASSRLDRAKVRLPDSYPPSTGPESQIEKQSSFLGMPLRLRATRSSPEPVSPESAPCTPASLRLSVVAEQNTRAHQAPPVFHLGKHQGALPQPSRQGLQQIRRARDLSLRFLARLIRAVLRGHGTLVPARTHAGPPRQQPGLFARKLPLGDTLPTSSEPTNQRLGRHARRSNDPGGRRQILRPETDNGLSTITPLAAREMVHPANPVPTYDLANVGRLNQFVVRGADKIPLIVHNCSGAVYDEGRATQEFSTDRYKLVIDLVEARPASLVAFNWHHQADALSAEAKKRGISHAVISGDTPMHKRTEIVDEFQAGNLQAVFAHPATAGHGLTLTRGVATIWPSPTDNSEYWTQFNHRIYRAGQTQRTEIIKVHAAGTIESRAYDNLEGKLTATAAFLNLVTKP